MFQRTLLAVLVLVAAIGCSRTEDVPEDLSMAALHELRSGKFDDAIRLASQALSEQPNNAEAYLYRGRAYQSRDAMGDHQLAIKDFGEAIRLAPESSDAYYSRGLVYRSLGQLAEAEADEDRARELDSLAQQVYSKLPEVTPLSGIDAKGEQASNETGPKTASELMREGDTSGFGQLGASSAQTSILPKSSEVAPNSPVAEFNKRQIAEAAKAQAAAADSAPQTDAFGRPIGAVLQDRAAVAPPAADATAAQGAAAQGTGTQGATAPNSAAMPPSFNRPLIPTPQSPFAARAPATMGGMPGYPPQAMTPHSPFAPPMSTQQPRLPQQPVRGATGFVRPTNPFGVQPGGATISRPFSTPTQPYDDRVVRPFNARDY